MTILKTQMSGAAPGLVFAALGTACAVAINTVLPAVSPLLIAIVLGAVCANVVALPAAIRPGLAIVSKGVLRVGVALLGLQLVLGDILGLGFGVIAVVVVVVGGGIAGTLWIGKRLGIPFSQRLLIACGSSICGAAAVAAVDGIVDAEEEDVAAAIACVVVFGTLMIPTLPFLAHLCGLSDADAGVWVGGSIHEVAQVVAAGGMIGGSALAIAVVVKLARVVMLAPVLAVISIRQRSASGDGGNRPPLVPLFVLGFLACVALRSCGILPDRVLDVGEQIQVFALTGAMFALGVGVRLSLFRSVGSRPFLLAAWATVLVGALGLGGALIVG
ncbi:putative sulfate exporter family transporter [Gordonia sp. HY285]|uniref:YeiH family protein n=1 Tax=Gordonia liuliyuniae TaxID=2911517 RepID=UPI001EFFA1A4|nr:putative sulfate exporter family transporter [Gordonia liuliyuniae]MCF8609296.1 putative sulfate exporter family transporter [Gordonia liuliyuniae]